MEMRNQIFNFKRFVAYTRYMVMVNWKKRALTAGSLIIVFIAIIAINMRGHWNENDWQNIGLIALIVSGVSIIASAFPGMRTKESIIQYLTIPASNFEKFISELITRYGTLALMPFIIKTIGNATIKTFAFLEATKEGLASPKVYSLFSFSSLNIDNELLTKIILIILAIATILFTGACVFKKNPLLKIVLFGGAVTGVLISYFYVLFEKVIPRWTTGNIHYIIRDFMKNDKTASLTLIALSIFTIWCLSYAFFKLKEKEL